MSRLTDVADVSPDALQLYLAEVGNHALLSFDEEQSLTRAVRAGQKAQATLETGTYPAQDKPALLQTVRAGKLARDQMVRHNLRLVVSIAVRHQHRGVPLDDIISEGNLGLMRAVDLFDPERGFRFSTYATWWIRQSCTRAIADQSRSVRLPVHLHERAEKIRRAGNELEQECGRRATAHELAARLDMDASRIEEVWYHTQSAVSLDQPVGADGDAELGDFLPSAGDVASEVARREIFDHLYDALETLPPRAARILKMRYGLDGGNPMTFEEVGQKFGLTRERIRQIEGKAIRQLRHPQRSRRMRA